MPGYPIDPDLLAGMLRKTAGLIEGIRPDRLAAATPCPDYDVAALRNHLVGWVQFFQEGVTGRPHELDVSGYEAGDDAAAVFANSADSIVEGFRGGAGKRSIEMTNSEMPGAAVYGMLFFEYVTHGWDLAIGTGQQVPYDDAEAAVGLEMAQGMLSPAYRGAGMPFGDEVPVPEDASMVDRLIGYSGRRPVTSPGDPGVS